MNMFSAAFQGMSSWISGGWGGAGRAYDAGRRDTPEMESFIASISDVSDEILTNRDDIVARARDLYRNNPTIKSAVDRVVEQVIGTSPWMESTPDWEAMGQTFEWANEFSTKAEARFRVFGDDPRRLCDTDRRLRLAEMLRTGFLHWIIDGETIFVRQRRNGQTSWKLVDSDRLSTPNGNADFQRLQNGNIIVGGCEISPSGVTVAYWFRRAHPASPTADAKQYTWDRIPRWTRSGGPQVIHAFEQLRADQRRGVSKLAAAMVVTKQRDRYRKAELGAAIIDALHWAFITSPYPSRDVRDALAPAGEGDNYLSSYLDIRAKNKIILEGGPRATVLAPGEKMETSSPSRPNNAYDSFTSSMDRDTIASIGGSYTASTGNFARMSFSAGKLENNVSYRAAVDQRSLYMQQTGALIYASWLEEQVATGEIEIPGGPENFYRFYGALTLCEWMGPGQTYGDAKKEAEAEELQVRLGGVSGSRLAAERGRNWMQEVRKRHRERQFLQSLEMIPIEDTRESAAGRPASASDSEADSEGGGDDGRDETGKFAPKPGDDSGDDEE